MIRPMLRLTDHNYLSERRPLSDQRLDEPSLVFILLSSSEQ
ncbi:MAG TPA: hypothetical protein VNT53_06270 [Pseudolysinimonas sp.]|nr:hypothetical protein [Pseudolysinimonas sp.]